MPQDATCPKCSHTFPVTEARGAYTVACPRCEAELTAEFQKPSAPPEAGEPPYNLKVKAGALPGTAAPPPPPRKKKDDEDDEPKRKGGSALVVLLSGGLGLLFVLGGLAATGWVLFTQIDVEPTSTARTNSNTNRNTPNPITPNRPNPITPNRPNPNPNFPNPTPNFPNPDPFPPAPAKKETFDLRPVGGALPPIVPPAAIDAAFTTQIALPGPAGAVAVGGGGRYIAFDIPSQSKVVVFDANTGGLLPNTIATGLGTTQLAAGANKLVTTVFATNKLRVYSLPDLQKLTEFDCPLFHGPQGIAMGSRTNGPLLASDPFGEVVLMDIASGKAIDGSQQKLSIRHENLRATPDGKTFMSGGGFGAEESYKLIEEVSSRWRVKDTSVQNAFFGPDGKRIYGKNQIVQTTGATLATKPASVTGDVWYVPALTPTGNLFLRVNESKAGGPAKPGVWLSVHKDRNVDIATIPVWEGLKETEGLVGAFAPFGADQLDRHLFLIPEAKLLVILTRDGMKLVVRKVGI